MEFLQSAKEQGAFVYLAEKKYDQVDLPCILVSDVRLAMAYLADFYYNHPSSKLGVVGITGTKGKSSTAYYLKYIFDEYLAAKGQPASGVISSIETYDGVEKFESHLTTPEPPGPGTPLCQRGGGGDPISHHGGLQPGPEV